jgi:hypothetical protein
MPNSPDDKGNGWGEWSRYVLKELERHNSLIEELNEKVIKIDGNVIEIKTKADAAILTKAQAEALVAELKTKQETLLDWKKFEEGRRSRANWLSVIAICLSSLIGILSLIFGVFLR